jgi:hypothetical protein
VETIPIPSIDASEGAEVARAAERCSQLGATVERLQEAVRSRIAPRLSNKLHEWWTLDSAAFRAEIKKQFKVDIPIVERTEWEAYLKTEREKVDALTREIADLESEIDRCVYTLFELTPDEISLLEQSLQGQY